MSTNPILKVISENESLRQQLQAERSLRSEALNAQNQFKAERDASIEDAIRLQARAERAEAELASLKAAGEGWIPCSPEHMPELDKPVLIWRFGFSGNERTEFGVVAMLTIDEESQDGSKYWEDWAGNDISCECVICWRPFLPPAPAKPAEGPAAKEGK